MIRILVGLLASLKMRVDEVHESSQRNGKGAVASIFCNHICHFCNIRSEFVDRAIERRRAPFFSWH